MKWVGGEVIKDAVEAEREGSGRHGWRRFRVISAWGRRWSQRSSGKSGWVEDSKAMRWFFAVLTALSAGLVL
jgi:hypothetical protein